MDFADLVQAGVVSILPANWRRAAILCRQRAFRWTDVGKGLPTYAMLAGSAMTARVPTCAD